MDRRLFAEATAKTVRESGIIAVLVVDEVEAAVPLARALLEGGINIMELTLRTPVAVEALRKIRLEVPEMVAGVGTVLTPQQVKEVKAAGAVFAVSPGLNPKVVEQAKEEGLSFAPGVATPSDVEQALELGCRLLKFFPAEPCGGLPYLKSMAAPYQHFDLEFLPLGGINAGNLAEYLGDPLISAVGGSWLARRQVIQAKDWDTIAKTAREARALIDQSRGRKG